jgi:hypothetical protein
MRRLDQRIRQIAQQPFTVGELELRCAQTDARSHFSADPPVHIIIEEILARTAEIATAASAERRGCENQGERN